MSTTPDWHSRVAPLLAEGLSCAVIAERLGMARCSVERVRRDMQTPAQGRWGGPSCAYRGARIECAPGGHVCGGT